MKKKLTRLLTLVVGLGAALFARAAGDIYDIRPCDALGTIQTGPVSSAVQPIEPGHPFYFAVRLMNRTMGGAKWTMTYKKTGSEIVDAIFSPLKIGIYVSGQLKFASYTGVYNEASTNVRDFIFSYTPEPGDFALPVKLATASGPADAGLVAGGDPSYVLLNDDKWGFYPGGDLLQDAAEFYMMGTPPYNPGVPGAQAKDVSLDKAGFYLKGIDFDSEYAGSLLENPRVWRKIHQNGSTCVDMSLPSVVVPGNTTNAVSIYVWTVGTDVAYLDGNTDSLGQPIEVEYQGLSEDHVTPYAAKVAKIEVPMGESIKTFKIKAVGAVGSKTTVYMSAYPTNQFDKAGMLIRNFVTRTIEVGEPEKPHLSIGFGAGEASAYTVTADADYKTYKTELMCRLSSREDYTGDVKVKLAARYADESGDLDLMNDPNVVFSLSEKGAGWSLRADELTIKGGEETARFFVYVRGANGHTADGIVLKATIEGEGAAHYETAGATAELTINPTAPKIALPVQNQVYEGALTGQAYPLTDFRIEDTYANLSSDAGYTVYYKRTYEKGGDTKFQKLADLFHPDLDGTAKDENGLLAIRLAKEGKATVQLYVVAPDGTSNKDNPRTFTVMVTQAPMVRAVVESGLDEDGNAPEGTNLNIRFVLTEEEYEEDLYAYIVPADEETAQNILSCTSLAAVGGNGIAIQKGHTNSTVVTQLRFKDGTQFGSIMNLGVLLSTDKKYKAPDGEGKGGTEQYDRFGSETLSLFCVNVVPTVRYVMMNGAEQVTENNGAFVTKTSQGVMNKFAVFAEEPSSIDLEAKDAAGKGDFFVRYTFYDGSAAPQVKIVSGNSNAMSEGVLTNTVDFAFQSAGRNRVVVALKDKDMDDYTDAAHSFTYYVDVNPTPGVQVKSGREDGSANYLETDIGPEMGLLSVELTMACETNLTVGLKIDHAKAGDTFALPTLNLPTGLYDLDGDGTAETELYVAEFRPGEYKPTTLVYFMTLDGTGASQQNGVKITPYVLTDGKSSFGPTLKDLYTFLPTYTVYPMNVVPTIIEPAEWMSAQTNKATIGVLTKRDWSVRDIEGDFKGEKAKVELTVEGITKTIAQGSATDDSAIVNGGTYEYEFTSPGVKTVIFSVTDKDGGQTQREMIFVIDPSKNVYVYPHGENMSAVTTLSTYYVNADGIGSGYIWKDKDAEHKYTQRHIYAFERSATSGVFLGLGDTTEWKGDGSTANLPKYDSFLYAWIAGTSGDNGMPVGTLMGLNPVRGKSANYATAVTRASTYERPIPLPSGDDYDEGANAYSDRYLEAIFAREFRESDNMGDINQDGVPDWYAVAKRYKGGVLAEIASGGAGAATGEGGAAPGYDLVNLRAFNDDEDYLPAGTTAGNRLVPNLGKWDASGLVFMALHEIRGFGLGLNQEGCDLDYTANEQRAWLLFKGLAEEGALIDMADDEVKTLFEANLDAAKADLANGVWTPENPTDPTSADTDDDGLGDGFEYWFWYAARVGFSKEGKWSGLLKGRRLNEEDIENWDEIAPADICAAFDPNVNNAFEDAADDFSAAYGNLMTRDFDNDGIYDMEEYLIGTSPVDCDTDDDGLPDGWEIMWGLNPLSADKPNGGGDNPDGDFMADAVFQGMALQVAHEGGEGYDFYLTEAETIPNGGDTIKASFIGHGDNIESCLRKLKGQTIPKAIDEIGDVTFAATDTIELTIAPDLHLIHDQVYKYYGFDPRTAWTGGDIHGYIGPRWCPICNTVDANVAKAGDAGLVVNTRAFTNLDEYLYGKYAGLRDGKGILARLKASCTNPNVTFEDKTYGDSESSFSSTVHGADTSGDGIPDGWEIYVGGDPIVTTPTWGSINSDPDLLANAAEFAGTDTCNVYADCETIAANSPVEGWANKFFPTDPGNADTDGDGITDDFEGMVWQAPFYAGRKVWPVAGYTFIYDCGIPLADTTLCQRGGGMNPCSSDTDFDGLPDLWEMEFAGIVVTPQAKVLDRQVNDDDMYTKALQISDGVGTADYAPKGNYIMGGMDATDGGDASTDGLPDDVVGTVRDRDFDRDGLENFQEYLVQAVRGWRYDDAETPLMGRSVIWTGDDGSTRLSEKVEDRGAFFPISMLSGAETFANLGMSAIADAVKTADNLYYAGSTAGDLTASGVTEYDYKAMGYMAPAEYEWDPFHQAGIASGATFGYRYMRHPNAMVAYTPGFGPMRSPGASYVSTDPRQWDSDADGMDDYWEIFHGLNPILGGIDLIGISYALAPIPVSDGMDNNVWGGFAGQVYPMMAAEGLGFDPIRRPWRMGLPLADPDGDGLRNLDEAISGNLTSPTTYHTDPTPLWMTDASNPLSYVSQYYRMRQSAGDMIPDLMVYPWTWSLDQGIGSAEGANIAYVFSHEQTEGYDTDGDFRTDAQEVVKSVLAISDPLDSTDPDRRASLYLPGQDACAYSYQEGNLPVVDAYDVFRQFTVECWVKPEEAGRAQTIVERGFAYPGSNLPNAVPVWRANFRIALDDTGHVYGLFDNDNAVESGSSGFSSQSVTGGELPLDKWSHIAMTFDGTNLSMYVNGKLDGTKETQLIPANGIAALLQEPCDTNLYPMATYATVPGANVIGARRLVPVFLPALGFAQFDEFFKGSVAEVRFWDGARTAAEVAAGYKVRMSVDDVKANREDVYKAWSDGATRNDADGKRKLPAQLLSLYNFQQLPAAVDAGDVALLPSGYEKNVMSNFPLEDKSLAEVGWWTNLGELKSTVYNDYRIVPWIQNTVSRLPFLDNSTADSMYWSETFAGNTMASENGVETYAFPNGGNPYKSRAYKAEADLHYWRMTRLGEYYGEVGEEAANRYAFQMRSEFVGIDDLVPLGGAFARLEAESWDGQGAETAWPDTGKDEDGDGLPDWWEEMYGGKDNVTPDTMVDYKGEQMPAWQAYMRDLAAGMQPSGTVDKAYASKADADGDGLVDWWQNLYSVKGGANGDMDGDGLANYVEYLLAEVFKLAPFDPTDAFSVNGTTSDYFFRVGQSYVGEIFTDHDRIADQWEDKFPNTYATRYLYDAMADADDDGWSNYAEFQAGTDPTKLASLGIDAVQMTEYPVPTIEAKITYEGTQNIGDKPFVVKAWRDSTLQTIPDAVWTIGGSGTTEIYENGGSNTVTGVKYVGMNPRKQMLLHLSPGSVVAGSFKMEFKDLNWILLDMTTGQAYASDPATAVWQGFVIDRQRNDDADKGDIIYQITDEVIGEIDYVTGAVTIDFSLLPELAWINGDVSAAGTAQVGATLVSIYILDSSYIRINWNSQPITGGSTVHYYLADPDKRSADNNSLGHVKEGLNTFVAFCDMDGDGKYTAGEPYGIATDVDVNWNYAKVSIELTDTTPVTARFSVGPSNGGNGGFGGETTGGNEATNDRTVLYGTESGNLDIQYVTTGKQSGGVFERVRVVRTLVNGRPVSDYGIPERVVLDKMVNVNNDPYLTEADFLRNGNLDIDWADFADDLAKGNQFTPQYVSNVTYRVVLGNGSVAPAETNNLLGIAFNRWFDAPAVYANDAKPVTLGPGIVTSAAPTFKWTIPGGLNSYTAFEILVYDDKGAEVWDSGFQPMPPRIKDATTASGWRYEWTAPIYADSVTPDGKKVFANNKNYSWYISLANSRYKNEVNWSDEESFRMNVLTNSVDYGVMNVAVRYFGPSAVAQSGKIRVQAFTTPDFSGMPVAEGYVKSLKDIADTEKEPVGNARIIGLEAGTYYVRAFVDTQADGKCAAWESWGFACERDLRGAAIYTPKAIKVGPKAGLGDVVTVYIEDCDIDQDNLPDAWEWSQKGNLTALNVGSLDQALTGGIAVKKSLTDTLNGSGSLTTGLAVMLSSSLKSPYVAAMMMGVDVSGSTSPTAAASAVAKAVGTVEENATPKMVKFTSITLDPTAQQAKLGVTTVVEAEIGGNGKVDPALTAIYEFPTTGSLTVTFRLWKKDALTDAKWVEVTSARRQVTVGESDSTVTLDLGTDVDLSNGFFKVTLEK